MDEYYNQMAPSYNELYGDEQLSKLEYIKDKLNSLDINIKKDSKLLDVGCGTGISQEFFEKNYGADTFGIDPAENLLKFNKYQHMEAYAEELPFEDSEFEIVISLTAIQNFDDIFIGLKEMKRVGNNLFIITFLKNSSKKDEIESKIKTLFEIIDEFEEEKDKVFICK